MRVRTDSTRAGVLGSAAVILSAGLLLAGCGGSTPKPSVASLGPTTTTTTTAASGGAGAASDSGPPAGGGSVGGGQLRMIGGSAAEMARYSACMRKNGVPSFPDPNAQGEISISVSAGIDPGSASFQKAQQACQNLLPNGGQPSPAQEAQARATALAFSACMRSHGLPNFPDPQFGPGGRVSLRISVGAGLDPRSSQFQAAQVACRKDMPGGAGIGTKAVSGGSGSG